MRTLLRGFIFGLVLIPVVITLLALIGFFSILLFIGLIRYIQLDIKTKQEKDGLKNAKSSKERVSNRSRFNNWLRRLGEGD